MDNVVEMTKKYIIVFAFNKFMLQYKNINQQNSIPSAKVILKFNI